MSGWVPQKGSIRILATVLFVAFLILLVALVFALRPERTEDFPEELRVALANSPRGFLPDDLRDGTIYLGMPHNRFAQIIRPIPMTQFDVFILITRGAAPLNLPIGKARVYQISLERNAVKAFYEDELTKILQNALVTFGRDDLRMVSDIDKAVVPMQSHNAHLIWYFDTLAVRLDYTPLHSVAAQTKSTNANPTLNSPQIKLHFMARRLMERSQDYALDKFRPPTPEELNKDFASWDRLCKESAEPKS